MKDEITNRTEERMKKSLEALKAELISVDMGRSDPSRRGL